MGTIFGATPVQLVDANGNQYTASGGGGGGTVEITDGTNGNAAIKPASTAAATTDPALVVAISPNNSVALASGVTTAITGVVQDASIQQTVGNGTLGTLNATQSVTVGRRSTLTVHVTGTFVGTLTLQAQLDGATWTNITGPATWVNQATGAYQTSITATGIYQSSVTGYTACRLTMSAYTSGSAVVYLACSDEPGMVAIDTPLPAGSAVIGQVNLTGNGGVVGTKAASTAPATTDLSLVVTQSPNYVGASTGSITALASTTNALSIKASAGSVFQVDVTNLGASSIYLKLYNLAAAPTVGTSVPAMTFTIAAGATFVQEFGQYGKRFPTGIAAAVTGAAAATDATAITAVSGTTLGLTYL